jgi:hypothetical protein
MLLAPGAHAAVIEANPSNYQAVVPGLAPGDTLRLASGTYTQGLSLSGMAGSASRPIVVTGPDDQSAVFTARDCCNTIQLDGTSFLQVMNLTLDGSGRVGPAGVDSRGDSHHITLENLKIVGYNGSPQSAAISTEGRAANWIIRHDTIVGAGTGLHLGNADGSQPFVAGLIEHNVMLDTTGPDMEIIGSTTRAARTVVRYNILSKAGAATADANEAYESYGNYVYPAVASASDSGSVRALAAATPTVTLTASPTTVAAGGTSTLTWSSTGADGCAASGGWTGTKSTSGSASVGPIQSATSYQLTCLGAGGNAAAMVQVNVGNVSTPPPTTDPTPTPTPTPTTPPAMGNSGSGGGGSFDMLTIGFLSLVICYRRRARSAAQT